MKKLEIRAQTQYELTSPLSLERPCAGGSKGLRKACCFQGDQILIRPPRPSNAGSFKIPPK